MAANLKELREEYPELTAQLEADAKAAAASESAQSERRRFQEIDAIAGTIDPALVREAKYGETACSAQELAYRAALANAKQGRAFLGDLEADNLASGAQNVGAAPAPDDGAAPSEARTPEQRMASARAEVKALFREEE